MPKTFNYGGQAVIEGVMIRGRRGGLGGGAPPQRRGAHPLRAALVLLHRPLRNLPLVRGIIVLAETLTLGSRP